MTYPISRITGHCRATGLPFHRAAEDLTARFGVAPVYACPECGELICSEPGRMCGACLSDPDYEDDNR